MAPEERVDPGDNPADEHRDPAAVARIAAIAARILRRHGVRPGSARRARGASNLTWLAGGLAIRVAASPGSDDLLREARLAQRLSPEVGYPRVLECGVEEGHEWLLAEEVRGDPLEESWPSLSWDDRERALLGMWQKVQAVHATQGAAADARSHSPFYAPTPETAEAQLASLESRRVLSPTRCASLRATLASFWDSLPQGHPVLCHGDPTAGNALVRDGRVVCLLDFEFAVIAPVELDAHSFLRGVDAQCDEPDPLPDPDGAGRRRLLEAASAAVLPALCHPRAAHRLLGYAVLFQLWALNLWLTNWGPDENYTTWRPYRLLAGLADGQGVYLSHALAPLHRD